jgi:hypothetical protein
MKRSQVVEIIREVLSEMSTTGTGASFTPGSGEQYATSYAFSKGTGKNKATKTAEKLGYKTVERPKRPSDTKMLTYLREEGASAYEAPYAFTTEEGLYTHSATKASEKLGMEVVNKPKNSSKKTSKTSSDHKKK